MNHDNLVKEFAEITGSDIEKATSFLVGASWRLEVALTNFYDSFGQSTDVVDAHSESETDEPVQHQPPPDVQKPKHSSKRIATVASIRSNDSSDDERQAFYAGGSEHSGQQVLGPENQGRPVERDFISRLLHDAHEHGEHIDHDRGATTRQTSVFSGVGYRLGQTTDDSMIVNASKNDSPVNRREIILKLWREGFSVDDGPLREYTDPANLEFLNKIRRGRLPEELINESQGDTVNLNMEDHRHEHYVAPKLKVKAFSGAGHLLGSPTPSFACEESRTDEETQVTETEEVEKEFVIDAEKPRTTIQIRLVDGSRIQLTFNHCHTIKDVRKQIEKTKPQYIGKHYKLMIFPNRELNNDDLTLEEAGILSSCILQRLM